MARWRANTARKSIYPHKPAGKHPTLRPSKTTTAALPSKVTESARITKPSSRKPAKPGKPHPNPWATATRRIYTRSQARIFRVLDLPAELRNVIWQHASTSHSPSSPEEGEVEEPLDLSTFTLPENLFALSRQVRAEALPVFFAENRFKMRVVSNYCVFRRHFHFLEHVRYRQAGKIKLAPVLANLRAKGQSTLDEQAIRFRHVTIQVDCVCCAPGKQIAEILLDVQGTQAKVEGRMTFTPREGDGSTAESVELLFEKVRGAVDALAVREGFNGFSVSEVVKLAGCLCYHGGERMEDGGRGQHH